MRFIHVVESEVERDEGKFASREELGGKIQDELEQAEPMTLDGDDGGSYSVTNWEVCEFEPEDWDLILKTGLAAVAQRRERREAKRLARLTRHATRRDAGARITLPSVCMIPGCGCDGTPHP